MIEQKPHKTRRGSPPRVRGKGSVDRHCFSPPRITPACAGKSWKFQQRYPQNRDHPRVCGEKGIHQFIHNGENGSPPRVRGKETPSRMARNCLRITPACAGKRSKAPSSLCRSGDHPRVCGEKQNQETTFVYYIGSPPRVRGKVLPRGEKPLQKGITPACAGKRLRTSSRRRRLWDHPRVCGEKISVIGIVRDGQGSPPRVRGKAVGDRPTPLPRGITPACAGKRGSRFCCCHTTRDHPRVCGEKLDDHLAEDTKPGSPPRVRGKVSQMQS